MTVKHGGSKIVNLASIAVIVFLKKTICRECVDKNLLLRYFNVRLTYIVISEINMQVRLKMEPRLLSSAKAEFEV